MTTALPSAPSTACLALGATPVPCVVLPAFSLIDGADAANATRKVTPSTRAIHSVHIAGRDRAWYLEALRAEDIPCSAGYTTPLYGMNAVIDERRKWVDLARAAGRDVTCPDSPEDEALPVAEHACAREGLWLSQQVLLGDERDLQDAVDAVDAVAKVHQASRSSQASHA